MDHEPCLPKEQWHENFRCTYPSQRHWSNIPAIPSLTSTSKKNQHSNFWDHQLTAVQCCSFSCICSGGQLCYPGLPGTLQPISWDPSGMFLCAETLGSFTKVFSDKTIQDTTEYFRLEGTLKTIMFHPPKRRGDIHKTDLVFWGYIWEQSKELFPHWILLLAVLQSQLASHSFSQLCQHTEGTASEPQQKVSNLLPTKAKGKNSLLRELLSQDGEEPLWTQTLQWKCLSPIATTSTSGIKSSINHSFKYFFWTLILKIFRVILLCTREKSWRKSICFNSWSQPTKTSEKEKKL